MYTYTNIHPYTVHIYVYFNIHIYTYTQTHSICICVRIYCMYAVGLAGVCISHTRPTRRRARVGLAVRISKNCAASYITSTVCAHRPLKALAGTLSMWLFSSRSLRMGEKRDREKTERTVVRFDHPPGKIRTPIQIWHCSEGGKI